jgi:tetratricopeptide (TPR) repeat protein
MTRFNNLEFDSRELSGKPLSKQDTCGEASRGAGFFYEKAQRSYLAGAFENALREYSRSLDNNPAFLQSWLGQIRMLIELGEYPEAIVWADKAQESFPDNSNLFALKALAYLRDGNCTEASAFSDLSVSKTEPSWLVWLVRAEVLRKKRTICLSCVDKALAGVSDRNRPLIMFEAGRCLFVSGYCAEAIKYFKAAAEFISDSALIWYELASCQKQLGFDQARDSIHHALEIRPDWKRALRLNESITGSSFLRRISRRIFRR